MNQIKKSKFKKYVLITGASSGIGYNLALEFAKQHFNLILVARSKEKLQSFATELQQKYGIKTHAFSYNLASIDEINSLYNEIHKQ